MSLVIVGLFFALFRFDYAFFSQNIDTTVVIDVLPDFLGYLLIWFGLEKTVNINRWFKESHLVATGMLIITFLSLLSSLSFFFSPMIDHPDIKIFLSFFTIVNMIVSRAGSLIFAVTMIFMFTLCSAIGYLMQQKEKNFSCVLMYFFSVAYTVLAVAYAINQFINLPFSLEWVNIPLGIVFLLSTYFITDKIEELR